MTRRLIGSDLSDQPSSPVRAKVKCGNFLDRFGYRIKVCSATRIPSSKVTGHHLWPIRRLVVVSSLVPRQSCSRHILQPQPAAQGKKMTLFSADLQISTPPDVIQSYKEKHFFEWLGSYPCEGDLASIFLAPPIERSLHTSMSVFV